MTFPSIKWSILKDNFIDPLGSSFAMGQRRFSAHLEPLLEVHHLRGKMDPWPVHMAYWGIRKYSGVIAILYLFDFLSGSQLGIGSMNTFLETGLRRSMHLERAFFLHLMIPASCKCMYTSMELFHPVAHKMARLMSAHHSTKHKKIKKSLCSSFKIPS